MLQSARFLVKSAAAAAAGEPLSGACRYLEPLRRGGAGAEAAPCGARGAAELRDLDLLLRLFETRARTFVADVAARLDPSHLLYSHLLFTPSPHGRSPRASTSCAVTAPRTTARGTHAPPTSSPPAASTATS